MEEVHVLFWRCGRLSLLSWSHLTADKSLYTVSLIVRERKTETMLIRHARLTNAGGLEMKS